MVLHDFFAAALLQIGTIFLSEHLKKVKLEALDVFCLGILVYCKFITHHTTLASPEGTEGHIEDIEN